MKPSQIITAAVLCLFLSVSMASAKTKTQDKPLAPMPKVLIKTTKGDIIVELNHEKAPISTKNFLQYANADFYDGTIFHRSIKNFMIQGGGYTTSFEAKPVKPPIINEAKNGLLNNRGTIAMARTNVWNSATSQFFINVVDNSFLNRKYAVFGHVIQGMDVVDAIVKIKTQALSKAFTDVPMTPVVIQDVIELKQATEAVTPTPTPNVE